MDVRNELKSLIAKNGTTLKKICEKLSTETGKSYIGNNITNKLRRKTIKFEEVQEIADALGYRIEFIRNEWHLTYVTFKNSLANTQKIW